MTFYGNFVGRLQGEKKKENRRGEEFKSDVQDFYVGQNQHQKRGKQQDTARGSELEKQSPEKLFRDMERLGPERKLFDFVQIDVAAVKAITGARVRCKLCPQIVDLAAFADALPEIAHVRAEMLARGSRRCGRRSRWRAHRQRV